MVVEKSLGRHLLPPFPFPSSSDVISSAPREISHRFSRPYSSVSIKNGSLSASRPLACGAIHQVIFITSRLETVTLRLANAGKTISAACTCALAEILEGLGLRVSSISSTRKPDGSKGRGGREFQYQQ